MTKSFIKKILPFNKFKEQEIDQIPALCEINMIKESENTKNNQSSLDVEKAENQSTTPTKHNEKIPSFEPHSRKVIVTDIIREKKVEEFSSISPVEQKKTAWFRRLQKGLALSSQRLSESIGELFVKEKLDKDTLQKLEDILIQADLGVETAAHITETIASSRYEKSLSPDNIHTIMANEIEKILE
ncbi:signal recognition particle receptor subunit alpha, partial [Bartonella sp. MR168JLCBS]|uniref:signal recognition particle receptor subunit alpha n=1 Tax=Bartonella sp. MR168JLCBS TaxID=3243556 RepID=UPI0035D08136